MSLPGVSDVGVIDAITSIHDQLQLTKYLAIASCTLLLYDWITNLDLEVRFIWGTPWSLGRLTYHFNRIWPIILLGTTLMPMLFAPASTPEVCKQATLSYAYGTVIQFSVVSSVFLIRCWALYGDRRLLWALCLALACTVAYSLTFVGIVLNKAVYLTNLLPILFTGCLVLLPSGMWMVYLASAVYELLVFMLTSWKIWKMTREHSTTPLAQRLAHNGMFYFILLLGLILFACIGGSTESVRLASSGSGIAGALSSVVCSRMALSLHEFSQSRRQIPSGTSGDPELATGQNASIPLGSVSAPGKLKSINRFEPL